MLPRNRIPRFSRSFWLTLGLFALLVIAFAIYAWSEKRIDRANELRHQSFALADELRYSSDDLTRMARTYVVTGNPTYKKYYQDILDIRDGKKARPEKYQDIYWDLMLADGKLPRQDSGRAVALLALIRQAGFTREEFRKLEQAKSNSDELTTTEFEAMKLVESSGADTGANRARARLMLHDDKYHQAKAAIMRPIHDFNELMDKRTLDAVQTAENNATTLRLLFAALGLGLMLTLWRNYAVLRATLGGSVEDVQMQIARIGGGDFSSAIPVVKGMENSVLGWLSETQIRLKDLDRERKMDTEALRESEARYRAVTQSASDAIVTADGAGNIVGWNRGAEVIFGYSEAEVNGQPLTLLIPPRYRERHLAGMNRVLSGGESHVIGKTLELEGLRKDQSEFPLELLLAKCEFAGGWFITGTMRDITGRKRAEAQIKLAAEVFEQSNEGFIITDAGNNIVLVNHAFTVITGYSEAEVLGRNPRMFGSGRHAPEFFRAMWETLASQGYWQGEVWDRRKDGSIYPKRLSISRVRDAQGIPTHYIGIFSDITEYKATEARIQQLAHFDTLTGLPNRALLSDRIHHDISMAQRNHASLVVLFLDLDHFKNVNDTLGHRIGDELLIEVAKRLKSVVREEDTVSRLGGDEFILVLPGTDADGATHVARKLLETVAQPYQIEQHELIITPSIGIAIYPSDGEDFDALSQCADVAMYRAKRDGRNSYRFFTAEMQARSARTLQLENALRHALERDQLRLHYQPQVSLQDGRIIGAEALLRWQHPELGLVSPVEFIPIAEDSGQILQIGEWVLRNAVSQMKTWIGNGLVPMTMAVNLSAVQFRHPSLPDLVVRILDEVQLLPQYLELELTEGVAMDDPLAAIAVMDVLHERGIRMSIDDFGTGYSSLSYLKRFQVYKLKIDQSFVRDITDDPDDKAIVGAIISLASSLGMRTIAEGVETEGQLAFLREKGCNEVQGYFFSKPLPADQFEMFVRGKSSSPDFS